MSTKYSTLFVAALWLSMPTAFSAHAAQASFQFGGDLSTAGQGTSGLGSGIPGLQARLGSTGFGQQAGGISMLSPNTQGGQGASTWFGGPSGVVADSSRQAVQVPNTEAEHGSLILAALLMVGMVVSRRLMR